MSIEITEEEIQAELKRFHINSYASQLLSEADIREAAIHRVFYRKKNELDKLIDTSDKRE